MTGIRFAYAETSRGQVHYAASGAADAPAVLLFHQCPRSWDEYREVLPLLGRTHRAIAMDIIGYGHSAAAPDHSIETYADTAVEFAGVLGLDRVTAVGHHTGALVALEAAVRAPELVSRLVLSSMPYYDAKARSEPHTVIDDVGFSADGSHLTRLWDARRPYYPADRPDLLTRFTRDALAAGDGAVAGHRACHRYPVEERSPKVGCPVLCVGASADPFAFPSLTRAAAGFADARVAVIEGGTIPLMEHRPGEAATLIAEFAS
ncbi:MAG: alpha/beta hydrolase [Streptosporangiales bacterium]|jgi:pimeloyl-ACP methyl ester carboxylesterase|nr:alpha/beta hydrolase [Streptosporangiales bacterium]